MKYFFIFILSSSIFASHEFPESHDNVIVGSTNESPALKVTETSENSIQSLYPGLTATYVVDGYILTLQLYSIHISQGLCRFGYANLALLGMEVIGISAASLATSLYFNHDEKFFDDYKEEILEGLDVFLKYQMIFFGFSNVARGYLIYYTYLSGLPLPEWIPASRGSLIHPQRIHSLFPEIKYSEFYNAANFYDLQFHGKALWRILFNYIPDEHPSGRGGTYKLVGWFMFPACVAMGLTQIYQFSIWD